MQKKSISPEEKVAVIILSYHIFAAFKLAFTNTIPMTWKQKIQMKTPTFLVDKYRSIAHLDFCA